MTRQTIVQAQPENQLHFHAHVLGQAENIKSAPSARLKTTNSYSVVCVLDSAQIRKLLPGPLRGYALDS